MDENFNIQSKVKKYKIQNIIDLALGFTAMGRVFEKGSTERIKTKLEGCLDGFLNVKTKEDYKTKHNEFCEWFINNIRTAERERDGRIIKYSNNASWGQAAKVIDIVLKVCIYYCALPSPEESLKLSQWLNGAIDTQILEDLKTRHSSPIFRTTATIEQINRSKYEELQVMIQNDIEKLYNNLIFPVQYDDIRWRELNR